MVSLTLVTPPIESSEDGKSSNRTTAVYQRMRADLVAGVFRSGVRLGIQALQERYGTGATPIREVLNRLSAEGFVKQIDQKGFRVPKFSQRELSDLIRARSLLNEILFREAIASASDASDEAIIVAHFRLSRIPKTLSGAKQSLNPAVEEAHKHFHQALIAPSGSPWLIEFNDRLFDLTTRYRVLTAPSQTHPNEDHRLIMEAVLDRDVSKAIALSNMHIRHVADLAIQALADFAPTKA